MFVYRHLYCAGTNLHVLVNNNNKMLTDKAATVM